MQILSPRTRLTHAILHPGQASLFVQDLDQRCRKYRAFFCRTQGNSPWRQLQQYAAQAAWQINMLQCQQSPFKPRCLTPRIILSFRLPDLFLSAPLLLPARGITHTHTHTLFTHYEAFANSPEHHLHTNPLSVFIS